MIEMRMSIGMNEYGVLYKLLLNNWEFKRNRIAINCDGDNLTYEKFIGMIDTLASNDWINNLKNRTVAMIMDNSIEFTVVLYALSKVGAVVFLVNPHFDIEAMRKLVDICKVEYVMTDRPDIWEKMINENYMEVYKNVRLGHMRDESGSVCEYGHLIQTSSGTTGVPKVSIRSDENISVDVQHICSSYQYDYEKTIYSAVPFYHGYGLTMGLISPLAAGMEIVFSKIFMLNRFCLFISKQKIDYFLGAPNTYKVLCNYENDLRGCVNNVSTYISSGSPLTKELSKLFYNMFKIWIVETYGMMEASSIAANMMPNQNNYYCVGKPVNGVQLRITDGYIYIKSDAISKYYITEQGIKPICLCDDWFCTNDTGFILDTGELVVNARSKEEK